MNEEMKKSIEKLVEQKEEEIKSLEKNIQCYKISRKVYLFGLIIAWIAAILSAIVYCMMPDDTITLKYISAQNKYHFQYIIAFGWTMFGFLYMQKSGKELCQSITKLIESLKKVEK